MRANLKYVLSDDRIDANQPRAQRQLLLSIAATPEKVGSNLPLNLCLVLDHSGSMRGNPLETVKKAALSLIDSLGDNDRLAVIAFDHRAKVILPNQPVADRLKIKKAIRELEAAGGTAIDEGIKLGMEESAKGGKDRVSHIFLLTDGENEHGNNDRCLKLAGIASEYSITVNGLGFGNHWNQDVLEKITDTSGGTLSHIEKPEQALVEFTRLFNRLQSVGLTNAHLILELDPRASLAELKPIAQVSPETIELEVKTEGNTYITRLGDLLVEGEKQVLINLYISSVPEGEMTIGRIKIRYDDPALPAKGLESESLPINIISTANHLSKVDERVEKSVLAVAMYRQTRIAEEKLKQGDRAGAATMLQTASNTALKLGQENAATVLQDNATRLQVGEELSEGDLKKTRIISKTRLQMD